MAAPNWTSAEVSAADLALLAADKPIIGANTIPVSPTLVRWNTAGTVAGADKTDSDYPIRRAYDGLVHLDTRTDGTAASTWYMVFNFGEGIEFDFVGLINHNFGTLSLTTVTVELDDGSPPDGTFGSTVEIANFGSPSDDTRLMDLECYHTGSVARRYTDVQYLRLKLSKGVNFTPQLGELILGRRRQLEYKPDVPFDDVGLYGSSKTTDTMSGVSQTTIYYERQYQLDAKWVVDAAAYRDDWLAFRRQCRNRCVWIYDPNTSPNDWHYMALESDDMPIPLVGPTERTVRIEAVEQGPEDYFLDVGNY